MASVLRENSNGIYGTASSRQRGDTEPLRVDAIIEDPNARDLTPLQKRTLRIVSGKLIEGCVFASDGRILRPDEYDALNPNAEKELHALGIVKIKVVSAIAGERRRLMDAFVVEPYDNSFVHNLDENSPFPTKDLIRWKSEVAGRLRIPNTYPGILHALAKLIEAQYRILAADGPDFNVNKIALAKGILVSLKDMGR